MNSNHKVRIHRLFLQVHELELVDQCDCHQVVLDWLRILTCDRDDFETKCCSELSILSQKGVNLG